MKIVLKSDQQYVVRIDAGEDVIAQLQNFCQQENITAASFTGIGSATQLTLSWYNAEDKDYIDHELKDKLEIISLTGNISMLEGQAAVHAHGSFSDYELNVRAGHVKKLIVSATCEIAVTVLPGQLTRAHEDTWGLKLLQ